METSDIIALIGIGLTIIGGIIGFGWLIFKSGILYNRVGSIEGDVSEIKTDFKSLSERTIEWGVKIDALWTKPLAEANSPRELSETGKKVLKDSGIQDIIDRHYDDILAVVQNQNPPNAYQVESWVIKVVRDLKRDPDVNSELQDCAFNAGTDVDSVLFVGALNIRDKILVALNFQKDDIDIHKP